MTRHFGFRPRHEDRKGCAPHSASLLPHSPSAGDPSHDRGGFFQGKGAFTRHVDPSAPRSIDGAELIRKLYEGDAERCPETDPPATDRLEQFIGTAGSVFLIVLGFALVLIGLFPGWMRAFGL